MNYIVAAVILVGVGLWLKSKFFSQREIQDTTGLANKAKQLESKINEIKSGIDKIPPEKTAEEIVLFWNKDSK